jgi:hypothetical protein
LAEAIFLGAAGADLDVAFFFCPPGPGPLEDAFGFGVAMFTFFRVNLYLY